MGSTERLYIFSKNMQFLVHNLRIEKPNTTIHILFNKCLIWIEPILDTYFVGSFKSFRYTFGLEKDIFILDTW